MSGRDDESCNIMQHHATSYDRERKGVGSGWRKMSFDRRRCGREMRWQERKAGGSRKHKGFPLQVQVNLKSPAENPDPWAGYGGFSNGVVEVWG